MAVGLVVRDLDEDGGGGGGRGGPEFEMGIGGRGLAEGRACGEKAKLRLEARFEVASVGEAAGETGDSGPLAVFARLLEPAEEGADSRLGLLGAGEEGLREG